ncbi:low molecular weight phosphotyrosine protein phosphatase [Hoyosella sp. G463]|uniref:protein-tyrosine-phosphatase n=1 Tax=Lolliginicoccus lacisalsi TaxID=2742202 RepID=A0A927PLN5_9ACTN|nr:low molecular weight phosphotyrosine protein phosphatase [Lolliginicoccus lacisalsi]
MHITFICTGNICRSPMAERILADALREQGLHDQVQVSSAGTGSWHVGEPADHRTVAALRDAGYTTEHVAATVAAEHLRADLILALDKGHVRELRKRGADFARVRLLREFDPDAQSWEVSDPYWGSQREFEEVREQIEAAIPGILDWIRARL